MRAATSPAVDAWKAGNDTLLREILEADIALEEAITAERGRPEFTFLHRSLRAIRDDHRQRSER